MNSMTEKPIDPMTYGPFCSNCHVVWKSTFFVLRIMIRSLLIPGENKWATFTIWKKEIYKNLAAPSLPSKFIIPRKINNFQSSRLACCVVVEKWMNDMIINIGINDHQHEENI